MGGVAAFAATAAELPLYDQGYAAADEIGCERPQPIILIFRPAVVNLNVLARNIAGFLQALEKRNGEFLVVIISGLGAEVPITGNARCSTITSNNIRMA